MSDHLCPVWVGYLLACPLRKLLQDPVAILAPHVRAGMLAIDVGCAMGFFTLPMAELVGPAGRVFAVDFQPRMLEGLCRHARRARVLDRIETRLCGPASLNNGDIAGQSDFALAFGVAHEVSDQARLFEELRAALKPGGRVSIGAFQKTVGIAKQKGFIAAGALDTPWSHAAILANL